jgi:protease-4
LKRAACGLVLAALAIACDGRPKSEGPKTEPPKKTGPAIAVLDLSSGVPEEEKGGLFGVTSGKRSFDEFLRVTRDLGTERGDRSKGVLVKLGSAAIGAARAMEIGEILGAIKTNKKVYCHADGLTNGTLMLAAKGCSSIWVSPGGEVDSIGIAAQLVYMRRLLADELHLNIDFLQVGKFKGAEEPLTRDGPSPEAKASLMGVLTDLRGSGLANLSAARPRATADIVEDGPWSPQKAKELGLVDEVGYADEAAKKLRDDTGAGRERVIFGSGSADDDGELDDLVRALAGESSVTGPIALLRATGSISMTAGGNGILGGRGGIVEKDFDAQIKKLEKDDEVKAVVVRIDSPGGSALASDLMWHHLMNLRKKKPLLFSIGDMAASGGYYLASTADYIFAEPMSIVGSIGVVGGKIGGVDALEKIGVHAETFAANQDKPGAAARAAWESPLAKWDDPTRARLLEMMTGAYELFLARVSEGRSTRGRTVTREQVAANAEGKIFSGNKGKELGLVDEIGGLGAAIAKARELANLDAKAHVATVQGKQGLFDGIDPAGADEKMRGEAAHATSAINTLEKVAPDLVPFVTSLAPLMEGEKTVVAVPYALTVR